MLYDRIAAAPANPRTPTHIEPAPRLPMITAERLTVRYGDQPPALHDISVTLYKGERTALIGPNGAGKSTFLKAIMGILRPTSGTLDVAADPQRIGYVPQNEDVKWDFPVTVRDVVMMGCTRRIGWLRPPAKSHWRIVDSALEQVGLRELANRQIGELSGGQRRRAFIARALAQDAELLILDEPFTGVDSGAQAELLAVLDHLNAHGITILFSTHDLDLAFRRFDRVMAVRRHLIAVGAPEQVFTTDTLAQLYGGRVIALQDGQPVSVYVDDHHCETCP